MLIDSPMRLPSLSPCSSAPGASGAVVVSTPGGDGGGLLDGEDLPVEADEGLSSVHVSSNVDRAHQKSETHLYFHSHISC